MRQLFLEQLAELAIRYSLCVQSGECVRLSGPVTAAPLLEVLARHVRQAGGQAVVAMPSVSCAEELERCTDETVAAVVHVLADSFGVSPQDAFNSSPHERHELLARFWRRVRYRQLRWLALPFPSTDLANDAGLSLDDWIVVLRAACFLDAPDPIRRWREQADRQARLIDFLQHVRELRLVTPAGTDLRLPVAGRYWLNGHGQENLPDGEVYSCPLENASVGMVVFDVPTCYAGQPIMGVHLRIDQGRVVDAHAAQGEEILYQLLAQDDGASALGEIGLGCNYAIRRPTCHPLTDEKIGGTFHLALGMAYPATGGRNVSALHWDLVGDLRSGGWIEADGHIISENGRFLHPDWPRPWA
ncbi:MAG: aminopeptidase [Gemmataceae bacterium]